MAILTTKNAVVGAVTESKSSWRQQLKSAVRDLGQLCDLLQLPAEFLADIEAVRQFPVFVPPAYLARIHPGEVNDPLLLQVLPVAAEDAAPVDFVLDPLSEIDAQVQPGLLHKYAGRVLLVITGVCAIHCRYCFRRHFPYDAAPASMEDWQPALQQIAADESISEVLLSGGDPLMVVDDNLRKLLRALDSVTHLKRIRIHTRLPIVVPQRVTEQLLELLDELRSKVIMVVHTNHAQEIDDQVADGFSRLTRSGILLFNQTVLLRRVNDNLRALTDLSNRLIECNVVPYYLHQLDRVAGAAHFEVPVEQGKQLIEEMRLQLPGYAIPRYVQEIPGQGSKTVLA